MKTNSLLGIFVFVLGLAAVCWVGLGYLGSNLPALAVTLLIAALYLVGALELYRYRQATGSLEDALAALDGEAPPLDQWLQGLHPSLRGPVQLRVETGRAGLPVPALTPYLVGMLVLLGMLGTLLGMVLTLRGTGMALQTATDLQAVRDSLAAPVSGLGVAFGASIAGVASSAALGLLSALVRRERIDVVQRLDAHIATTLRGHSQAHQREQALDLLQQQAGTMPALVERLESMMTALERQSQAAHEQQARQQEAFHASTHAACGELAQSVGQSLQASAAEGARLAGQALAPAMESAARELVERIGERMQSVADGTATAWQQALAGQQAANEALLARQQQALDGAAEGLAGHASTLLQGVGEAQAKLQAELAERDEQRLAIWRDSLAGISEALRAQWSQLTEQTRVHASETVAEISNLMQAAAEGPRAAAETIAELRHTLSESMARDGAMLEERTRMLQTLDTLLEAVNSASGEQRAAIDALVTTSSNLLERVGARFGEQIEAGSSRLEQASGRLGAGADDVASLGQSFAGAVQAFSDSSTGLMERLQTIEGALDRSLERSDEQLAYYVAQAREVVDLSVLSQRQIIENLQQLADQADSPGADAA